jgi:hypothetical protein
MREKISPSELIESIDRELAFHHKSFDNSTPNRIRSDSRPTLRDISKRDSWRRVLLRQIEALDFDRYTTEWVHLDVLERATNSLRRWGEVNTLENVVTADGTLSDPLTAIREILGKFRDVASPERWLEILFLANVDPELHKRLCSDLDEAHSSLVAQNWKAATVVSASVMEALLHWWLQDKETLTSNTALSVFIKRASDNHGLFKSSSSNDTKDAGDEKSKKEVAMCAANYRNLIHADKAKRLKTTCTRATAWTTFGATLTVAEAIGKKL